MKINEIEMKLFVKLFAILLSAGGIIALIITIAIVVFDSSIFNWSFSLDLNNAGNLGSFFAGIVGTLFSGAAFFLLYINFYQSDINSFENRLFLMLNLLNDKIKTTSGYEGYKNDNKEYPLNGLEFFEKSISYFNSFLLNYTSSEEFKKNKDEKYKSIPTWFNKINMAINYNKPFDKDINDNIIKDYINEKYLQFFSFRKLQLSHYFRYLYRIIKVIDSKKGLSFKEKRQYVDIVQAQMSHAELGLVFYNCLSEKGDNRFLPLINKYNFLENLDKSYIIYPNFLSRFYKVNFKFDRDQWKPKKIDLPFEGINFSKYSGERLNKTSY